MKRLMRLSLLTCALFSKMTLASCFNCFSFDVAAVKAAMLQDLSAEIMIENLPRLIAVVDLIQKLGRKIPKIEAIELRTISEDNDNHSSGDEQAQDNNEDGYLATRLHYKNFTHNFKQFNDSFQQGLLLAVARKGQTHERIVAIATNCEHISPDSIANIRAFVKLPTKQLYTQFNESWNLMDRYLRAAYTDLIQTSISLRFLNKTRCCLKSNKIKGLKTVSILIKNVINLSNAIGIAMS